MYFYIKLITIFNNNLNFNKFHTYIRRNPEKETKRFSNRKLNKNGSIVLPKPVLKN